MTLLAWCMAWTLDVFIGDPSHWLHPVCWIGRLITVSQRVMRHVYHNGRVLHIDGGVTWLAVTGLTWGVARSALALAYGLHPWLGWLVRVWMIFTVLAGRCLAQSAMVVARPLQAGDLVESWHKFSWIVGRDTSQFQPAQINHVVVETVVEGMVDGITAPLFFLLLGGMPLTVAYRTVNILDSMVGYKHERYRAIGMVSARLDDVANLLPTRLS